MADTWRFSDEWAVRAAAGLPGVTPQAVEQFRGEKKKYLSHALIDAGLVTQERFVKAAETLFRTAYSALYPERVDKFALSLVPEKICRKHGLIPVKVLDAEIKVAMADPADLTAQADVEALTGRRVLPQFCLPREVEACMEQLFSSDTVIFDLLSKVEAPEEILVLGEKNSGDSQDASVTSPVIKLVNSIISQAYRKGSSDIHIEHEEKSSHVRIRVDGELKNVMRLPRHIAVGAVVSRIKIMSDLDVSNHFIPQDGRTKLRIGSAEVGLRVSTLPTSFGEKVVMRILDQRAAEVPFEKLGFAPEVVSGLDKCLTSTQGIILVTGPTGSGKTTTLYSVLNKVKSERTNVVTVEDPIEYKLPGINQVQVNEKQGLSFAAVLRSVLRQDPDIIMVGEIRDKETADIAFQAAMTGHLVLSTLHTNDTVATLSRLVDMGVDRFKISPGLLAITAQRLVRRLCPLCRQQVPAAEASPAILQALAAHGLEKTCYRAVGCKSCEMSGYAGRTSIVELLLINGKVKELINNNATAEDITRAAIETCALRTMTRDALWNMATGQADLKEVEPYLKLEKDQGARPAPAPAAPAAAVPAAQTPSPAMPAGKPRVMVADDDPVMRMLLKKFIENSGYEAIEAADGEEALTKIAEGPAPDLLISDINMPRMNGYDLVKGVRGALGLLDLPVIMLTTESSDKSQELAFQMGADDYVMKPFKGPLVMARVTAALRRAGRVK
ncbi:MAG TPA: type II secretion system protein GspE [Elusimicrobia bacterium]|nr:type II secretion system protein GspE [Elusimicrobiota bacterium]HAU89627.1 type II secretion system protein GspE [Elusimicrobiota bacterium]